MSQDKGVYYLEFIYKYRTLCLVKGIASFLDTCLLQTRHIMPVCLHACFRVADIPEHEVEIVFNVLEIIPYVKHTANSVDVHCCSHNPTSLFLILWRDFLMSGWNQVSRGITSARTIKVTATSLLSIKWSNPKRLLTKSWLM